MGETIHVIPDLDRKGLREFGLVTGGIIVGLFGLGFPWLFNFALPVWPWIVGGVLVAWAIVAPDSLRSPYRVWMRFGLLLSRITTPIIMGVAFFLVIFPTGALMRLLGKDPLVRGVDKSAQSYRVKSQKAPKKNMEKPF